MADLFVPALCVLLGFGVIAAVYHLGKGVRAARQAFSESEAPTNPMGQAQRGQRLLGRWSKLSPERQRLVEQLTGELELAEYLTRQ